MILADTVARTIIAPAELPIGIVTALMGSPFFLGILLFRPQRESGRMGVGA
ncbi:MAG: iron chelate uptake ABC transporter family permease subunit [Pirellula staleyi]